MKLLFLKVSKSFFTFFYLNSSSTYFLKSFLVCFLTLQESKTSHSSVTFQYKNSEKWGPKKQKNLKAMLQNAEQQKDPVKGRKRMTIATSLHQNKKEFLNYPCTRRKILQVFIIPVTAITVTLYLRNLNLIPESVWSG